MDRRDYSPQFTFTATSDSAEFSLVTVGAPPGQAGVSGVVVAAIPEPACIMMIGLGGGLIALCRRFFGRG